MVQVTVKLCLPRDASSVSISRRVVRSALNALGVIDDIRYDVELALTEACANVVQHAAYSDEYEVTIDIEGTTCSIDVIDSGHGYDEEMLEASMPHPNAEEGRGLHLIRMLAENVRLAHHPKQGTIMHFEKKLEWEPQSPVSRLAGLER
ncbi:ATP-binding protein [Planosporangium sp. 12N6]|uniref:ATP-binding protein n=1 Tax=Planosporangium spinosum TaxID=3402278 RepID=UPI003CF7BD49